MQDEVSTLEDKVDNLSAEFSALSSQVVHTQDKMNDLRQQLQSQRQLNQDGTQSKKVGSIKEFKKGGSGFIDPCVYTMGLRPF